MVARTSPVPPTIITFSESELERYARHGVASLRAPYHGFDIDLKPLYQVACPSHVHVRMLPEFPELMFYTEKTRHPAKAQILPSDISQLVVRIKSEHPRKDYEGVILPQLGFTRWR